MGNIGFNRSMLWGICFQVLATAIFSFHYIAAKKLLESIDTYALISLRGVIGGLITFIIYSMQSQRKNKWEWSYKNLLFLSLMVILGYVLNQYLFLSGLKRTSAGNTALLVNSLPLLVYGLALLFRQEQFHLKKAVSMGIGFAAIGFYIWHIKTVNLVGDLQGSLMILGAFACLAGSLLISKKQMQQIPPTVITSLLLFFGGLSVYLVNKPDLIETLSICFSSMEFIWLFFFEVIITTLAWFFNMHAIDRLGVSNASAINFLQIPIAATLGYFYFGTVPEFNLYILTIVLVPISWVIITQGKSVKASRL